MPLQQKPHTFVFETAAQTINAGDKSAEPPAYTAQASVGGFLIPKTQGAAYAEAGIELRQPFLVLLDVDDGKTRKIGDRFTCTTAPYDGATYEVSTPPMVKMAGSGADHVSFYSNALEFAE